MRTINDIINGKSKVNTKIKSIMKELVNENLALDLDEDELQEVLETEITNEMIENIEQLIKCRKGTWDYFDVMRIIGIM